MSKYTIEKPEFMAGAEEARFRPRVIIACLITLAVFAVYNIAATVIGLVYVGVKVFTDTSLAFGSFNDIFGSLMRIILSEPFVLILLFSMALLLLFTVIQIRSIERRKLRTAGLVKEGFAKRYLAGAAAGLLMLFILILPAIITEYKYISYIGIKPTVFLFLAAFLIQTAAEELLFRGYLLTAAARRIGVLWAVLVSSFVFTLLHILNSGITALALVQIFLLGCFLGLYTVRTNSIWGAFGIHFAWNFFQGLFSPLDVSGAVVDYRIISFDRISFEPLKDNIWGEPADLIGVGILLAVIAVILFAGSKRLVVKKLQNTEELPQEDL